MPWFGFTGYGLLQDMLTAGIMTDPECSVDLDMGMRWGEGSCHLPQGFWVWLSPMHFCFSKIFESFFDGFK